MVSRLTANGKYRLRVFAASRPVIPDPLILRAAMTVPRAVIFDMDGLMFNTEDIYFEVGSQLMRRRGCELAT